MVVGFFFYFLDIGAENSLLIHILSINNEFMNTANFQLRIVSSLVGKRIEAVSCLPRQVSYKLVPIYMKNIVRRLCAYCALF